MLLKKPINIISTCPSYPVPGLSSCITSSIFSVNDQRPPRAHGIRYTGLTTRKHVQPSLSSSSTRRGYASVSSTPPGRPSDSSMDDLGWPTSLNPTPYEIFSHPRNAKYNKASFYELVKIYHPDRHLATTDLSISHAVRLERYRLVVAANEILSDPAKRRAYDLHGAGWDDRRTMHTLYRESDRSWRNEPGNPSQNATWEDWEKWHREKNGDKEPQTRVFMSNELFVLLLCSFVLLGSLTQARRANNTTMHIVEMRDQKDAAISGDMRRRLDEKAALGRHERVESFLRQRDSWNFASSAVNDSPAPASQGK